MAGGGDEVEDTLHLAKKADAAHVRREDAGDVMVFTVANPNIYPKQAGEIAATLRGAMLAASHPKVLVDLSQVEFISSAFIGELVELHRQARAASGDLKICVTGEHVAYTMKLVKLGNVMHIAGNREELLESFRT